MGLYKNLRIIRADDIKNYQILRNEYEKLFESYANLTIQAQHDGDQYNQLRIDFSIFKGEVKSQIDILCEGHKGIIDQNNRSFRAYKRDLGNSQLLQIFRN